MLARSTAHPDLGGSASQSRAVHRTRLCSNIPAIVRQYNRVASGGFGKKRARDADTVVFTRRSVPDVTPDCIFRSCVHARREATIALFGSTFLLPQRSAFAVADAAHFAPAIASWIGADARRCFSSVVVDPPWRNRSASRGGGYTTGGGVLKTIGNLPLADWISPGALVGVWVTHDPKVVALARSWCTCWLGPDTTIVEFAWLKVSETGEPCFPLPSATASVDTRKPYEVLLLARSGGTAAAAAIDAKVLPPALVFNSVPSQHSRKPPLAGLLAPYLGLHGPREGDTDDGITHLEIFGRELRPGSLCIGDDALKFNEKNGVYFK